MLADAHSPLSTDLVDVGPFVSQGRVPSHKQSGEIAFDDAEQLVAQVAAITTEVVLGDIYRNACEIASRFSDVAAAMVLKLGDHGTFAAV